MKSSEKAYIFMKNHLSLVKWIYIFSPLKSMDEWNGMRWDEWGRECAGCLVPSIFCQYGKPGRMKVPSKKWIPHTHSILISVSWNSPFGCHSDNMPHIFNLFTFALAFLRNKTMKSFHVLSNVSRRKTFIRSLLFWIAHVLIANGSNLYAIFEILDSKTLLYFLISLVMKYTHSIFANFEYSYM